MKAALEKIRDYTQQHAELLKSHHFLFNAPLNGPINNADVVIIGLNPGETASDWLYEGSTPTEESSEYDFHSDSFRGKSSNRWITLCNEYLPNSRIVLSEFFFWSSSDIKSGFRDRFGYSFKKCPHLEFCKELNSELVLFHRPKLIVSTGTFWAEFMAKKYDLDHVTTLNCESDECQRRIIVHYEWQSIPFIFTPHWTSGFVSKAEKQEIKSYLSDFL